MPPAMKRLSSQAQLRINRGGEPICAGDADCQVRGVSATWTARGFSWCAVRSQVWDCRLGQLPRGPTGPVLRQSNFRFGSSEIQARRGNTVHRTASAEKNEFGLLFNNTDIYCQLFFGPHEPFEFYIADAPDHW